jgi:hypothetical protein
MILGLLMLIELLLGLEDLFAGIAFPDDLTHLAVALRQRKSYTSITNTNSY